MNILFLEDRGADAYFTKTALEAEGHYVLQAYNLHDAQDHWNRCKQVPVHCIILDCQTPMRGLTDEQKARAEGGTLSGWVWLRDNVLPSAPEMRQRTIIYSAYVDTLEDKVPRKEYEGIRVICKPGCLSLPGPLVAAIKDISLMCDGALGKRRKGRRS